MTMQHELWPGLDHIANFLNALDTEGMDNEGVRSAIYTECLSPRNSSPEWTVIRLTPWQLQTLKDIINKSQLKGYPEKVMAGCIGALKVGDRT